MPAGIAAVIAMIFSSRARLVDQRVGEHLGVSGRVGLRLDLRAADDVERVDAMQLVLGGLGGRVALALLGHDVDEDRALLGIAHVFQTGSR